MAASGLVTASIGCLGGFVFGYDTGIMSSAGDLVSSEFGVGSNDAVTKGFVTSIALFGAMAGSMFGSTLLLALGIRITAFIAASLCLFGGLTTAFSTELWIFMALRFVLGIGVGLVGVVCPLYVAEVAPSSRRKTFEVLFQLSLTFGILISYIVAYAFVQLCGTNNQTIAWRGMVATGGTISALALMAAVFYGMIETQKKTTESIYKNTADTKSKKKGFLHLFSLSQIKRTITATVLSITLQFTGINAIMYFGPQIIQNAGFDNGVALNIGIGAWNFLMTFIALILVEKFGKKTLMVVGTAVMSVSLIVVGLFLDHHVVDEDDRLKKAIGVATGLAFFLAGFESGPGCLFWNLLGDVFETQLKETGTSYGNVLQWGFNLIVSSFFLQLVQTIGQDKTFYLFGGIGAVCTLYLSLMLEKEESTSDIRELDNSNT